MFILFLKKLSILLGLLVSETILAFVEILQQPITNFHFKVFTANTQNKMDQNMYMKICARNVYTFYCGHLCLLKDVDVNVPPRLKQKTQLE